MQKINNLKNETGKLPTTNKVVPIVNCISTLRFDIDKSAHD